MTEKHTIQSLRQLSDAELGEVFGLARQLEGIKTQLAEADKLQGKARTEVEEKLLERMTPRVDASDLRWMVEDAKRAASKSGKEEACDCSPGSVM